MLSCRQACSPRSGLIRVGAADTLGYRIGMNRMKWNPALYEQFGRERLEPAHDLIALLEPTTDPCVVDLGCGCGEVTALLHEALHAYQTVGLDSSEEMIARTGNHVANSLWFEQRDIADFQADACYDVVFSNAALHWLEDHEALFARLRAALAPRGQLAVQMPRNFNHPSQRAVAAAAAEEPFVTALGGWRRISPVLTGSEYSRLLAQLGFAHQHVEVRTYLHHLPDGEAAIRWMEGALLTPYRARLSDSLYERFLDTIRARFLPTVAGESPYLYTFDRLLLWARLP